MIELCDVYGIRWTREGGYEVILVDEDSDITEEQWMHLAASINRILRNPLRIVEAGVLDAKEGRLHDLGSFSQYVEDDIC